MKKKFGLHEPYFVGNEKKYLLSCIKDNWVSTSGKFLRCSPSFKWNYRTSFKFNLIKSKY